MTADMPSDPDMLAAEFALGVLEGEARALALRRALAEPDFAADVEQWRQHFAQLFDRWPDALPPADGLSRLDAALDRAGPPDNAPTRIWRGLAVLASIAAALLLVVTLTLWQRPMAVAPQLIAQLHIEGTTKPIAARWDPSSGTLRVAGAASPDRKHVLELWVIPGDGKPRSLGVLPSHGDTTSRPDAVRRDQLSDGVTLALSIEPPGGSPTGLPTGAVVATAVLTKI